MNLKRQPQGFSLIEVLCAILILGLGLVGLTEGITAALSSNKESERQTTAALLAAGQVETLRAQGYLMPGTREGEGEGDLALYLWKESITSASIEGLYEVAVTVAHAGSGQPIYELRTFLFDPPAYTPSDRGPAREENRRKERRRP